MNSTQRHDGTFRALRILKAGDTSKTSLCELTSSDLAEGDVTIEISYSDLNFKDGRVMEPGSTIPARLPITPGIDFAGTVTESANPRFIAGDKVVANGFGLGTDRDGGLAQRTRVPGAWLTPIPRGLSEWHAAAIGTAGYTAALAIDALIDAGVRPDSGPILVTGAGGGVGTISTILLSAAGFEVVASTGRGDELSASLKRLGATEVIGRLTVTSDIGLAPMRWAGVIDSAGSNTLAAAIASTRYSGVVAAVGLAQGIDLPTTVLPFLLRRVSLLGIDSVYASAQHRRRAWDRLSGIDQGLLASIVTVVGLEDAWRISQDVVAGRVHGRVVVDVHQ